MKSKEKPQGQSSIFTSLKDTIKPKYPLYQLEKLIPWEVFEEAYEDTYSEELIKSHKILEQTRNSKDKIYSFHEPDVKCISKGKKHKRYEFGSKVSILTTKNSNIIVGAVNFTENIYDGNTLPPA
jgi:hypothetical protein